MEAARTSETLVGNYFTRQYIPEDNSELHTRRRENFKSHISDKFRRIFSIKNINEEAEFLIFNLAYRIWVGLY
jgi:hypothetical protein